MHPRTAFRSLLFLLCAIALCVSASAQTATTITIRLLDGKTGKLIVASNFLVRIDHDQTVHANWVTQNDDGSNKLTLPKNATLLTFQATYDSAEQIYISCDASAEKNKVGDHWYDVATILSTGIAAPDECVKPREVAKFKIVVKPGELVFFVRRRTLIEQAREDFSDR